MTGREVLLSVVLGLLINECCDVSPWMARRLVRWAAHHRYVRPGRAEVRTEELSALINDRPGKIFKLVTAACFAAVAAAVCVGRGMWHRTPSRIKRLARQVAPDRTGVPPEAFEDAARVLRSALAGDSDAVVGTFDAVVDRAGVSGAYDVAWCLAATVVDQDIRHGGWTLDLSGVDQVGYDARWVPGFVSAYVNQDASGGTALFGAALHDGQLPECLITLAWSAVATLRRRAN